MPEPQQETPEPAVPQPNPAVVVVENVTTNTIPTPAPAVPIIAPSPVAAPQTSAPPAPVTPTATPYAIPDSPPLTSEAPTAGTDTSITWQASEFHVHEKSIIWYLVLAIVTIGAGAILYFLTGSIITPIVVAVSGIMLGIFSAHQPGQLEYAMNNKGLRVGSKQYSYDEFRLFVMMPQSSYPEIMLIPAKRFMPSLSIRYTPEVETKVFDILADHLPFEERPLDFIDSLMQRIRF